MKFESKNIGTQYEILKRKLGGELFAPVTLDGTAFTNGVCKAGVPITAEGKIDNGTGSEEKTSVAVGILLNDVYDETPNGTIVKAFACVNEANCNKNAGITLDASVKKALPLIVFE
ncbi:hypothetical protein MUY40_28130 [Blautia sp. NSJ-159]|uniref:hypothetical protein n=1 Tax=unclassified Blautia TaxID=2648079 RepID=UPI000CDB57F2|nr:MULTISPECIES: hypothetical protein [unclassified Blautia]MCJ8020810.1 hypothetical protein [Blautia sp. NSJ-159]MCJ8043708.1 hypothetical protein [Blautia sp. NSJ-165]POP37531.1 hypothetical protein C3R19_14435 [Blautia producta]